MEKERAWQLKTVACDVADAAATDKCDGQWQPNLGAEELKEAAFAKTEGTIELTHGIRDAGDFATVSEILFLTPGGEHVHEDKLGVSAVGFLFQILQFAKDSAGEGTSEMAEEDKHDHAFLGRLSESLV